MDHEWERGVSVQSPVFCGDRMLGVNIMTLHRSSGAEGLNAFLRTNEAWPDARRILGLSRRFPSNMRRALTALAVSALVFLPSLAEAAQPNRGNRVVVQNDRGGAVAERVRQVEDLRRSGAQVEVRGSYCMSSCTLYLGLASTCVSRSTKFGFHGPSSQYAGISLPPKDFEYWSQVMASYYPGPLRSWFLNTGRNVTVGFYEITGAELIRMGVSECA